MSRGYVAFFANPERNYSVFAHFPEPQRVQAAPNCWIMEPHRVPVKHYRLHLHLDPAYYCGLRRRVDFPAAGAGGGFAFVGPLKVAIHAAIEGDGFHLRHHNGNIFVILVLRIQQNLLDVGALPTANQRRLGAEAWLVDLKYL